MELQEMIKKLLESPIIENQELGAVLLSAPGVTDEERKIYIDKFVEDYQSGKIDFFTEENKNLLRDWVELYLPTVKEDVKNRVKKI